MSKKEKKATWGEWFMFYFGIFAAICCLASATPVLWWRNARVDTNVGNRFSMERYYTLTGATDQFGKEVSWFSLKKKFQRKTEEFGRPSPLTALLGTATAMIGGGGPAMGCAMWTACKDHVNMRYMSYMSVSYQGICTAVCMFLSCLLTAATQLFMSFEDGSEKKKKKKKSDEDTLTPKGKTMTCMIFAWLFSVSGICIFMFGLDAALQGFKKTAYYPYAASGAAAYVACVGCFIQFVAMVISVNRVTPLCGGKKKGGDEDDDGEALAGKGYGKGKGEWYA